MRCLPAVLVLLFLPGCGGEDYPSTLDKVLATGELVVGTEPEFPPFESLNVDREFIGFDMDLAREIANELDVDLRLDAMGWDALPTALGTGKIDLIISGMTATPKRAESRSFTDPYFHTRLCLLVGVDSGINDPEDVGSKRIVVKLGTTGDINAKDLFPDAQITKLDTEGACAMEVIQGRAEAFLYDQHSIERHHRAHPETTRAILKPLSEEPYAMACRLGDRKFVDRLNAFLEDIRADGRYARLYEKHFGSPPPDAR